MVLYKLCNAMLTAIRQQVNTSPGKYEFTVHGGRVTDETTTIWSDFAASDRKQKDIDLMVKIHNNEHTIETLAYTLMQESLETVNLEKLAALVRS